MENDDKNLFDLELIVNIRTLFIQFIYIYAYLYYVDIHTYILFRLIYNCTNFGYIKTQLK